MVNIQPMGLVKRDPVIRRHPVSGLGDTIIVGDDVAAVSFEDKLAASRQKKKRKAK